MLFPILIIVIMFPFELSGMRIKSKQQQHKLFNIRNSTLRNMWMHESWNWSISLEKTNKLAKFFHLTDRWRAVLNFGFISTNVCKFYLLYTYMYFLLDSRHIKLVRRIHSRSVRIYIRIFILTHPFGMTSLKPSKCGWLKFYK